VQIVHAILFLPAIIIDKLIIWVIEKSLKLAVEYMISVSIKLDGKLGY